MHHCSALVRVALVAAGSVLVVGMASAPASAAPTHTKPPQKSYYGGYAQTTGTASSVQATIVLPTYTCKKGDNLGPGIQAFDNTANAWDQEFIYLGCSKTGKKYEPSYGGTGIEIDGVYIFPDLVMSAGDSIEFTTTCGPTGTVSTIEDLNSSQSVSNSSTAASSCTSGGAGDLGIAGKGTGGQSNLPTFGAIDYTNVTVNGVGIGATSPVATNYYEGKKNEITTGALTDDGTAFTTTQSS